MSKEEAEQMLRQACASISTNYETHQKLQEAVTVLASEPAKDVEVVDNKDGKDEND